VIAVGDFSVGD